MILSHDSKSRIKPWLNNKGLIPVGLESPYGGVTKSWIKANVEYGRRCMRDCLERGEAPYASHLLYTQPGVLNDANVHQRDLGIEAGRTWYPMSEYLVYYIDRGWSLGMTESFRRYALTGSMPFKIRSVQSRRIEENLPDLLPHTKERVLTYLRSQPPVGLTGVKL